MSNRNARYATVEQESPGKCPILGEGDLNAKNSRQYDDFCQGYFDVKDVPEDKQVRKVIAGIRDQRMKDHISTDRARIIAMTFPEFLQELKDNWLDKNWEAVTRVQLLRMVQTRDQSFRDYLVALLAQNSLLMGTTSHLSHAKLRHQLEAGLELRLAQKVESDTVIAALDADNFTDWNVEVKRVDDALRAETVHFEEIASRNRDKSRRDHQNQNPDPPTRKNSSNAAASSSNATASSAPFTRLPKLTENERALLMDNHGCLKCRRLFVYHLSKDCTNDWPNPATYRTITAADITAAGKVGRIRNNVNAVMSANSNATASGSTVAAVVTPNPVAYVAANMQNVLDDDAEYTDSDDSAKVSAYRPPLCAAVLSKTEIPTSTVTQVEEKAGTAPLFEPHLWWRCSTEASDFFPQTFNALIDHGSHAVLIREDLVDTLLLRRRRLHKPETIELAMESNGQKSQIVLREYVKLKLYDPSNYWQSRTVRAIITPTLCAPVILGLPFLVHNHIVIDHADRTVIDKKSGFDLLNPKPPTPPPPPKTTLKDLFTKVMATRKLVSAELKLSCRERYVEAEKIGAVNVIAAVRQTVENISAKIKLEEMGVKMIFDFKDVFEPIPHVNRLPADVYCTIELKDATQRITSRSYSTPRKYREAWKTLIEQHVKAGRLRPSNSAHASPAFLVPKADPNDLPRWVNDYRVLNTNTVLDAFPLPRVDDILADCAQATVWSALDMTNSFFQTLMKPEDIWKTAVTTPFGLYEWIVMPMGLRNSPPIHQRRVTAALRHLIGKICHVYVDDVIIWSKSIADHTRDVRLVLEALREAGLYLNPKKCRFYRTEIDFLGHHISARGIEANSSKVDKILNWPVPKSATDVRSFLGLVRYISVYLPNLAEYTCILTPLTTKAAKAEFPVWTDAHHEAFQEIKALVTSRECLTVIDHVNPGDNKIFVTCDASDWRTGGVLSFGPTWETARPVAFDSMQLKGAEKHYPVHEKELLAIIRALKKWRSDLLGSKIVVYTDHRTLENFNTQKDLSRRQLRWQELMSQFEMDIAYIKGDDNCVADALSRLPPNECEHIPDYHEVWATSPVGAVLSVTTDAAVLADIRTGYGTDPFCQKLVDSETTGVKNVDGLWYIGSRMVIPRYGDLRENLFRLSHDCLGHFGTDKAYAALRSSYYWPNMRRDLEMAYIPGCIACQKNKSRTTKPAGPLHPLPVPDARGDSVAIDFIGPLPLDEGYDMVCSMTDRLGSDIQLVPTIATLTADQMALLFFDHWYCENGLPKTIVCDRDKLFVSRFWKALHKLIGVSIKMSSAYHPETDGSSERTNKTVDQSIRYFVQRNQKGWVRSLPRVRFNMLNTVNASTGFSGFQLKMGRSPRLLPPVLESLPIELTGTKEAVDAAAIIERIAVDVQDAKDALAAAKVAQAHYANAHRGTEDVFVVGDLVMLSTFNRRREYKKKGELRVAKFFPRWDGPYRVTKSFPESSSYVLDTPNTPNKCPSYHASELKRHIPNDDTLFPSRSLPEPGPILTEDGLQEHHIDSILDSKRQGRGWKYLVRWTGYGSEHDEWIAGKFLKDNEALDVWLDNGGDGPVER